ncbi:MAG: hypothetical protein R2832_18575, partial [Rhodothermales bacterium]
MNRQSLISLLGVAAITAVVFVSAFIWSRQTSANWIVLRSFDQGRKASAADSSAQIVMVYFGSSNCSFCAADSLPRIVQDVAAKLRSEAAERDLSFNAIGVSLDSSVDKGLKHLRTVASFDEISIGSRWGNTLAFKYIWDELPGRAATPEVVVLFRQREITDSGYSLVEEKEIQRKVGLIELSKWNRTGS